MIIFQPLNNLQKFHLWYVEKCRNFYILLRGRSSWQYDDKSVDNILCECIFNSMEKFFPVHLYAEVNGNEKNFKSSARKREAKRENRFIYRSVSSRNISRKFSQKEILVSFLCSIFHENDIKSWVSRNVTVLTHRKVSSV